MASARAGNAFATAMYTHHIMASSRYASLANISGSALRDLKPFEYAHRSLPPSHRRDWFLSHCITYCAMVRFAWRQKMISTAC
jgi:hypothetical protein